MTHPASRTWSRTLRLSIRLLAVVVVWLPSGWVARAQEPVSQAVVTSVNPGTRRALIVCGLPGDDEHRKLFAATVEKLHKALTGQYGFAAAEVLVRFGVESQSGDGPALAGARGLSNREGIAADVGRDAEAARPGGHALGDRDGACSLRRPAFSSEHPRS